MKWKPTGTIALAAALCVGNRLVRLSNAERLASDDRPGPANTVRVSEEARGLLQCVHGYGRASGIREARPAFHQDVRWNSGEVFVFAHAPTSMPRAPPIVCPPDPSTVGIPRGQAASTFGSDMFGGFAGSSSDSERDNPTTPSLTWRRPGRTEVSYVKEIDWNGVPAGIGAGINRLFEAHAGRTELVPPVSLRIPPGRD